MSDPTVAPPNYASIFDLGGKRAMVVGGGSGIGREVARGLADHNAHVIVAERNTDGAAETVAQLASGEVLELDVLDVDQIDRAAADHPDLDVLVFTAATNVRKRIVDYTPAELDRVIDLNLKASFHLIRAFGGSMAQRPNGGSIIGFSSIRAVAVEPGQSVYAATKAGVIQVLRTAAAELGPQRVRCNAIAPGVVTTPLTQQIRDNKEWNDAYAQKSALGRWAAPHEMVGAAVYLASDASSFVTGSVLYVDGGWTAIDGRFEPPN